MSDATACRPVRLLRVATDLLIGRRHLEDLVDELQIMQAGRRWMCAQIVAQVERGEEPEPFPG